MGSKPTKMESNNATSQFINMDLNMDNNSLDPRSPAECRTPINLQNKRVNRNVQLASVDVHDQELNKENTLDVLRKRFLKSFTYNLNDPRSPTLNLNRTPLVFEDTLEKSLSLDDTFADLFVESRMPEKAEQLIDTRDEQGSDSEMLEEKVIIDLEEPTASPQTPVVIQQEFDPRSPSIGVERTPIIFTDDEADEANEDIMLESILATLSLNMNSSGNSSGVSITSQNVNNNFQNKIDLRVVPKPINKHLNLERAGKKNSTAKNRKPKRRLSQQQIYEDQENNMAMTPKLRVSQADKKHSLTVKRTPLSCVRNRDGIHARSRSVESSAKSIKTRLALKCFDDTLHPSENYKVPNLRIKQQGSQDSLEL